MRMRECVRDGLLAVCCIPLIVSGVVAARHPEAPFAVFAIVMAFGGVIGLFVLFGKYAALLSPSRFDEYDNLLGVQPDSPLYPRPQQRPPPPQGSGGPPADWYAGIRPSPADNVREVDRQLFELQSRLAQLTNRLVSPQEAMQFAEALAAARNEQAPEPVERTRVIDLNGSDTDV